MTPRLSLIAALDTDGRVYFTLTHANTDSDVMLVFMRHLMMQLDREDSDWRKKTVFLLDGARYHTSEEMREYLRKMELRVIYSGPYSYSTAPIELLFGGLKLGELNQKREPTGKKVSTPFLHLFVCLSRRAWVRGIVERFIVEGPPHRPVLLVLASGSGYGRRPAAADLKEHIRPLLAPHDAAALQVPLLRADLSPTNCVEAD